MSLKDRALAHAALGDEKRLLVVDHLAVGDLTVAELGEVTGLAGNLLAHHLRVLAEAELIERRISEGDRRRKYVSLRRDRLPAGSGRGGVPPASVAFVCTHNSARSQFAAALWERETGMGAASAGNHPASVVHPKAVRVAVEHGVDISEAEPAGYESIVGLPDLVVSVCDRARETGVPDAVEQRHWSVPDPVPIGTLTAFRDAFDEIARRVDHLAGRQT